MNGREAARQDARAAMSLKKFSRAELAKRAEVDAGTIGSFLAGRSWPRDSSLAKIGEQLGLGSDHLRAVAAGEAAPRYAHRDHGVPTDAVEQLKRIVSLPDADQAMREFLRLRAMLLGREQLAGEIFPELDDDDDWEGK